MGQQRGRWPLLSTGLLLLRLHIRSLVESANLGDLQLSSTVNPSTAMKGHHVVQSSEQPKGLRAFAHGPVNGIGTIPGVLDAP